MKRLKAFLLEALLVVLPGPRYLRSPNLYLKHSCILVRDTGLTCHVEKINGGATLLEARLFSRIAGGIDEAECDGVVRIVIVKNNDLRLLGLDRLRIGLFSLLGLDCWTTLVGLMDRVTDRGSNTALMLRGMRSGPLSSIDDDGILVGTDLIAGGSKLA